MFAIWGRDERDEPEVGGRPDVVIHAVMTFADGAPSYEALLELVNSKLLCHKRWVAVRWRSSIAQASASMHLHDALLEMLQSSVAGDWCGLAVRPIVFVFGVFTRAMVRRFRRRIQVEERGDPLWIPCQVPLQPHCAPPLASPPSPPLPAVAVLSCRPQHADTLRCGACCSGGRGRAHPITTHGGPDWWLRPAGGRHGAHGARTARPVRAHAPGAPPLGGAPRTPRPLCSNAAWWRLMCAMAPWFHPARCNG